MDLLPIQYGRGFTCRVCSIQDFICENEAVEEGPVTVGALGCQDLAQHICSAGGLQLDCKVGAAIVHPVLWVQLLQNPDHPGHGSMDKVPS